MHRPLMQHGVGQLEEMFASGKADPRMLKQLESELQYRQVPRAVALLAEVQAAMYGVAVAPQVPTVAALPPARAPAPAPVSQQSDLWARPAAPPVVAVPPVAPVRAVISAAKQMESSPVTKTPAMPLEDAYKLLKASPGAAWEFLEQSRRTLVQQSHPSRRKVLSPEKQTQALAEATRVNAAYAALSLARCGGR
jgi:hypothetical protein